MADWRIDVGEEISTGLHFDEPSVACWLGTASGRILAVRLIGPRILQIGVGWTDLAAVFPAAEGLGVAVVTSPGEVWLAPRSGADPETAVLIATLPSRTLAAALAPDGQILCLGEDGSVHVVTVADNAATVVALPDAVPGATAIAVNPTAGTFTLLVPPGELHTFDLAGASLGPPVALAGAGVAIASPPPGVGTVTLLSDSGAIDAVLEDGTAIPGTTAFPGAAAIARWHSLLMLAVADRLELHEWGVDPAPALAISSPLDPLVLGGWSPLTVDYGSAGVTRDDVEWRVVEGLEAGSVSLAATNPRLSGGVQDHRVLSGIVPGELHIEAARRSDGAVLATHLVRVIRFWPDDETGPPTVVTGEQQVFAKGGWGGGPAGPQNIRTNPAPEDFRVAVVVFRTKGSKSTVDAEERRTQFVEYMKGPGLSVKRYYEEVSYRSTPPSANPMDPKGTTVTLAGDEVFGPVDLDYSWGELYAAGGTNPWDAWAPFVGTWSLLGGAFSRFLVERDPALIDKILRAIDAVVFAVLPGNDDPVTVGDKTTPAQWTWAYAGNTQLHWKWMETGSAMFKTIPAVNMTAAFPANHPAPWSEKEWVSTICHELGHNLRCPDLYNWGNFVAEIGDRYVDTWDLMCTDAPLPHFSLSHRMRLGWINPAWVESIDFGGVPASRSVTLQSIETVTRSGPSAGAKAGVEIRIRDNWNYYFEYRRRQGTQIGDAQIGASALLGTEVHLAEADAHKRPLILTLAKDADDDGPILRSPNTDYEESDTTNPERMFDFRLTRGSSILNPNLLNVQVDYVGAHRAQLQISPAPGGGNFKSPDIDLDGPAGPNRVARGLVNTITFRVRNAGTKAAKSVRARVKWLPFTTAAGEWVELPDPPRQDIPAHSVRTFTLPWMPPADLRLKDVEVKHFCIRVDIDRYIDPLDPAGNEIVISDNWAQSNFTSDGVGHGSPSERKTTPLASTNVLPFAATYQTWIDQSNPFFRAYLDHAWHRLQPGETAVTQLSYESLAGDPLHGRDFDHLFRQTLGERMRNDLSAQTLTMGEGRRCGPIHLWGAQLFLQAGLRTEIHDLRGNVDVARGIVVAGDDRQPVIRGSVRVVIWSAVRPEEQVWNEGPVQLDGTFQVYLGHMLANLSNREEVVIRAYYLGDQGYAPCQSRDVRLG